MNKKYIPGVVVVEGTHDVSKLSTLYESTYVVTNGYEIPEKERNFLKVLDNNIQIIILTDNDEAGKKIRETLKEIKPNAINVEISAPRTSKKKGVAECGLEDIGNALDKYTKEQIKNISIDLYKLGLVGRENSKELREIITNKFNLGLVNKSNMIKRLNLLGIKKEQLIEEIKHATSK